MADHIFMLAGEASGDKLGGSILREMRARGYGDRIIGIGGIEMQAEGLEPLFEMEELTVLGIGGAIKNYSHLKKRLDQLVQHIRLTKPRMVFTIDSKAFSLRLGKTLKAIMAKEGWSVPVVHLVAPTVWAWGSWRAKSIPHSVDHLLCLFPFEVPYFTKYGASAHAVGHPAIDIEWPSPHQARAHLNLAQDDIVIGLFPGSRRREVAGLLPEMAEAIRLLRQSHPQIKAILPAASSVRQIIEEFLTPEDGIQLLDETDRYHAMKAADYGLICSGTVTLETALSGLHGSAYYAADPVSVFIGKRLVDVTKVILPNAITGEEIYTLEINKEFSSSSIAAKIDAFLDAPKASPLDDIGQKLKTALTPHGNSGERGIKFDHNVVDVIDDIFNAS